MGSLVASSLVLPAGGLSSTATPAMASKEVTRTGYGKKYNFDVRPTPCTDHCPSAADATSHLFFAYLRSLTPDSPQGITGISNLPRSLQALLASTEYPPVAQDLLQSRTSKVVMVVETVSPTPFALLRRAKNFQYRDDDVVLQRFSDYEDPVDALTDECRRVLRSISNANDSSSAKESTSLKDPSWSRFEDMGFGSFGDDSDVDLKTESTPNLGRTAQHPHGLRTTPLSNNLGRPTTPSWADFLSSGFVDEKQTQPTLLLPPDKVLPPINVAMRGHSSQSHRRTAEESSLLEPGELANIAVFALDDAFWWVWITSLSGEEPPARKAAFGRCALIETRISKSWLVMEEIIKGAAPEPEAGAYVAEKKSRFGFSKRSKMSRTKSTRVPASKIDPIGRSNESTMPSKTSIAPDQRSRIQAAAAALQEKNRREAEVSSPRRARHGEEVAAKTTSTLTLQPVIVKEAAPAMKWASSYDKNTIRSQYLGNNLAGRGSAIDLKDVLESSANSTRSATTPNPAAPPAKPDDGIPMVEKPLPSEPAPASITELPQETPNEPAVQNGTAGGLSADDFFASQLPAVVKPTSAELSPARPSPAEVEEVKPAAPIQQERKPLAPVVPSTMPPEPPQDREEPAQQYPRPMERSAFSPLQQAENRQLPDPSRPPKTPDQSATPASPIIQAPASPESPRNKLKKRNPPIGFKGMFSRRKFDEQSRAAAKPVPKQAPNSSSVAAARAALEAKAKQSQAAAPPQTNKVTTKRFSTLANKGPVVESAAAQATAARTTNQSPVVATRAPPPVPARQEESPAQAAGSQPPVEHQDRPISTTDTTGSALDPVEEQRAATEFGTFDQGPLEENPYNLEESPTRTSAGAEHEEATPIAPTHEEAAASAEPVAAADESNEAPGDRWAQIRKNAAERAARMSEDQTGVVDKTDDGETDDGEESKLAGTA